MSKQGATRSSNVDIRDHHLGRIASVGPDSTVVSVDVGTLIRRLLLFERCTVESVLLKEVPTLVRVFGEDGFRDLLDAKALALIVDVATAGQVGQTSSLKSAQK